MFHKSCRKKINADGTVDMTPMLDIVFIMLIFFIVTAVFLDERGLAFASPPDGQVKQKTSQTISVYVDAKDQVSVDSVVTELSAVGSQVERRLADKPEANVLLVADAEASLNTVVNIQDQMNAAGRPTVMKVNPPQ